MQTATDNALTADYRPTNECALYRRQFARQFQKISRPLSVTRKRFDIGSTGAARPIFPDVELVLEIEHHSWNEWPICNALVRIDEKGAKPSPAERSG